MATGAGEPLVGTRADAVDTLAVAEVAKRIDRTQQYRVIIGHCGDPEAGQALLQAFTALVPCVQAWCVESGPAIGAHAGPGALVISYQPVIPESV